MSQSVALPTAGLVVLKDNALLLAYSTNKQAWYLPGGKVDPGESAQQALQREIHEELNLLLDAQRLAYLCHISAPAYGEASNVIMEQECFLYDLQQDRISANQEIGAIDYFSIKDYLKQAAQVPGVLMVYDFLRGQGRLVE